MELKRTSEPLEIRLARGVTVSASIMVPESLRAHVKANLVPRRNRPDRGLLFSPVKELPTRTATLSAGGSLRF